VRVIGKAVAALDAFLEGDGELTLTELARRLAMSRSTVHRSLDVEDASIRLAPA